MNASERAWREYDWAAEYCARHGFTGEEGSPLPALMSDEAYSLINADPEAFARRVTETAYALARAAGDEAQND